MTLVLEIAGSLMLIFCIEYTEAVIERTFLVSHKERKKLGFKPTHVYRGASLQLVFHEVSRRSGPNA